MRGASIWWWFSLSRSNANPGILPFVIIPGAVPLLLVHFLGWISIQGLWRYARKSLLLNHFFFQLWLCLWTLLFWFSKQQYIGFIYPWWPHHLKRSHCEWSQALGISGFIPSGCQQDSFQVMLKSTPPHKYALDGAGIKPACQGGNLRILRKLFRIKMGVWTNVGLRKGGLFLHFLSQHLGEHHENWIPVISKSVTYQCTQPFPTSFTVCQSKKVGLTLQVTRKCLQSHHY